MKKKAPKSKKAKILSLCDLHNIKGGLIDSVTEGTLQVENTDLSVRGREVRTGRTHGSK